MKDFLTFRKMLTPVAGAISFLGGYDSLYRHRNCRYYTS